MKPTDVKETNIELFLAALESFLKVIFQSAESCPMYAISTVILTYCREIKQLCTYLKEKLGGKFPGYGNIGVAGFIFLRFFNPAIVTPEKVLPGITSIAYNIYCN
jgi:hypothetical protein